MGLLCLFTGLTMLLGYANKARCLGPRFDADGRSTPGYTDRAYGQACYSDIQHLWLGRQIDEHVFPYLSGGITPDGSLYGGVVEYPVLTGILIWLGALFADTDAGFLLGSALLMAPFGLGIAWWLGHLRGWRALLWALGPPLVLYSFHNWDLPVIACATAAVYVTARSARGLRERATLAAVLLGLGFAFKIYPAIFVLPLTLLVLSGGRDGAESPPGVRYDVRGALQVAGAAAGTAVLVNVPFAVLGFEGWAASFEFQSRRQVDLSTNSIWYWGFRAVADTERFQDTISVVSPLLVIASLVLACGLGWRRMRRTGTYPWVAVSAAMLCGFLLLHKVHSPQYTLWLLPFFVLVSVRWGWIVAYLVADLAMGISIFVWLHLTTIGEGYSIYEGFTAQALMIGVWGRAALLIGLFVAFLGARSPVDDSPPEPSTSRRPEHAR